MLHRHKFEPAVGAEALLDGTPVRVHSRNNDGTLLVFGERLQKRVDPADLSPPPEKSLLERWCAERIAMVPQALGAARPEDLATPVTDALVDYRRFLDREGCAADWPTSQWVFERMMRHLGHAPVSALWRAPGDTTVRTRRLFRFLLKGASR